MDRVRQRSWWGWMAVAVGWLAAGGPAQGQDPRHPELTANSRGLYFNPYNNPYMNPFLNPIAALRPIDRETALYYFLKANEANGGIGSGRLSGLRPAAPTAPPPAARRPRAAMVPGATAAGHFGRGPITPANSDAGFGRQNRYFGNIAH